MSEQVIVPDKMVPHNIEAEQAVLGALLIDPGFTDAKIELASSYVHQLETGLMDQPTAVAEIISMSDLALAVVPADRI